MNYYQISYPRSGANWLRYIARNLLQINKEYKETDVETDLYIKTHYLPIPNTKAYNKDGGVILLLRDFKECIVSHTGVKDTPTPHRLEQYTDLIQIYHNHPTKKMIVYYNDLILNPLAIVYQLVSFFDQQVDASVTARFCSRMSEHQANSRQQYVGECKSQNDLHYYQRKLNVPRWNAYVSQNISSELLQYIQPFLTNDD